MSRRGGGVAGTQPSKMVPGKAFGRCLVVVSSIATAHPLHSTIDPPMLRISAQVVCIPKPCAPSSRLVPVRARCNAW